ncbi:MAG: carboxypeptidase-like regulatory domain-containing protein [Proteobacteria bacterium]|nr:carboxypeptidase-like regulatory domain-containing protein [Pseudomonadota bacterium]MBU1738430.1 carboxypeptidase-like regulatory domain-containing protein [Pseudomonadota bacterium]
MLIFSENTSVVCAGTVEGVILSRRGPVIGSTLKAYRDYDSLTAGSGAIEAEKGEKEGQYKLNLPPGRYYLFAEGVENGRKLYSYHGINPITVTDGYLWLPFFMVEAHDPVCRTADGQGVEGRITFKGEPLDRGVVTIYRQQDGKFRGMGLLTNTVDGKHGFRFDLEPGSYVLIARKKQNDRGIGPVMQGDLFCYPSANPLEVLPDQYCKVEVECYPRDDLHAFLDEDAINPQGRRHDTRREASLKDIEPEGILIPSTGNPATLFGTVQDADGSVGSDLVVTAYPANGLDLFQMHILRLISHYMSRTDKDGKFQIEIDTGGTYYLVAREKVGEAPGRLEKYGLYEGNQNHSITVNPGETKSGIKITVKPIMPYSGLAKRLKDL